MGMTSLESGARPRNGRRRVDVRVLSILGGFCLLMLLGGLFLLRHASVAERRIRAMKAWPAAEGRLSNLEIREELGGGRSLRPGHRLYLRYDFSVEGKPYSGILYSVGQDWSVKRSEIEAWLESAGISSNPAAIGAAVRVRYDPEDPRDCVLKVPEVPPSMAGAWIMGCCISALGIGGLVAMIRSIGSVPGVAGGAATAVVAESPVPDLRGDRAPAALVDAAARLIQEGGTGDPRVELRRRCPGYGEGEYRDAMDQAYKDQNL
jgi:hypothetical protein